MEQQQSAPSRKKIKFILVMILVSLPFITLLFWALGGGRGKQSDTDQKDGFNLSLPGVMIDDSTSLDKLSLYDQATKDSLRRAEAEQLDPYSNWAMADSTATEDFGYDPSGATVAPFDPAYVPDVPASGRQRDANEARVRKKLAELESRLQEQKPASEQEQPEAVAGSEVSRQIDELQQMMQQMQTPSGPDLEMGQMQDVLNKILDIQHPGQARERMLQESRKNRGRIYTVERQPEERRGDLLEAPTDTGSHLSPAFAAAEPTGFYELEDEGTRPESDNSVPALIHETQILVSGATVKMRLTQDIYLRGVQIPSGTFVFGFCSLEGERLNISVSNIRYRNNLYPVNLNAFDMDGLAGVRVPGAISRDVAKQGTDQAIQSLELYTMDPSLTAQAASAGVSTLKSLLSQKAKLVKVTVRAGYPLLLKDTNTQEQ